MAWTKTLLASFLAFITLSTISPAGAFSGKFEICDLCVDSPFQVDVTSTVNSTVSFIFFDENTPQVEPVSCCATWAVGLSPPAEPILGTCSNESVHVSFPPGTYNGVANLYIQIAHTYEDDSVGQAPYNVLTLIGGVNLTYGGYGSTPDYECDMSAAKCQSSSNAVILGEVTEAVA